ncbi:6453_t:CDS:2 [Gigaspora margarita]|uniref:tRNA (uracil-O(2)-)-methyltransferase n=1 Tax=Gigaspora margarita TaxID=4874 RepID=A0ABN7VCQ2_GIGMA|nr:6453_t:CDS:2 [Gigaspora margarita]
MDQECRRFEPRYFFNNEKIPFRTWNNQTWYTIAEAKVPFHKDVFQKVIERWTKEVHLIIPPVEYAEIINDVEFEINDTDHNESLSIKPVRTILRRLIPKRKDKDEELEELIEYYENVHESRVVYSPIIKSLQEPAEVNIPFYYPKVSCFSYVYAEYKRIYNTDMADYNGLDDNDDQSWLYFEIIPLSSIHHDLLVPKDLYMLTYKYLKEKYAKELVGNWTEKTDPAKFVFEDIAIASWLISLWKLERQEKCQTRLQSFVDLGCGNVETLQPNIATYSDVDWIIGNHADELVPW